jgi:hypothetical protein
MTCTARPDESNMHTNLQRLTLHEYEAPTINNVPDDESGTSQLHISTQLVFQRL